MKAAIFLFTISVLVCGCGNEPGERHYKEVVIAAPSSQMQAMSGDPHAGLGLDMPNVNEKSHHESALAWKAPAGWKEEPGSGMRMATFKLADRPDDIDVSIVPLSGAAGGLQANLQRWAGQIGLEIAPADFNGFINDASVVKTQAGAEASIYNFTILQKGLNDSTKSMIAAMIELGEETVFVKMTGTIKTVTQNYEAFKQLTQSVHSHETH